MRVFRIGGGGLYTDPERGLQRSGRRLRLSPLAQRRPSNRLHSTISLPRRLGDSGPPQTDQ